MLSLLRESNFCRYWLGVNLSYFGSSLTAFALPLIIYQRTGSPFQTSLALVVHLGPMVVLGLLVGALADRLDRRRIMVVANVVAGLAMLSVPVIDRVVGGGVSHIYAAVLIKSTAAVWEEAAAFGALTALVPRAKLVEANSALATATTTLAVMSPAVGGFLVSVWGIVPLFLLDALSFFVVAVLLLTIRRSFSSGTAPAERRQPLAGLPASIAEGLRYLAGHRLIRTLTFAGTGNALSGGVASGLLVVFAIQELGLRTDDPRIGTLFGAGALGTLLASLLLPPATKRLGAGQVTVYALTAAPALLFLFAGLRTFASAAIVYALWRVAFSAVSINGIAIRQQLVPDELQSRVNTAARLLTLGAMPVGSLLGGAVATVLPASATIALFALGVAASAVLAWSAGLAQYRRPPAASEA